MPKVDLGFGRTKDIKLHLKWCASLDVLGEAMYL